MKTRKKKNSAALITLLVATVSHSTVGFVPSRCSSSLRLQQQQNKHIKSRHNKCWNGHHRMRTLGGRRERSFPSLSYTQDDDTSDGSISKTVPLHIDTSCYEPQIDTIQSWLSSLTKVERSEPTWLSSTTNEDDSNASSDIMTISPSLLIQEHLDAMYTGFHAPILFPTEADRIKFDFEWRYALLSILPQNDLDQALTNAQSNSHPLSMYLAAIPPGCCLNLHVHPAIEVFVPLVGNIHERRAMKVLLPKEQLCRSFDMEVGGMGGLFTSQPTPEDIDTITKDISSRITFPDLGEVGAFTERSIDFGVVELNPIGSVHQSFTTRKDTGRDNEVVDDGGSLLFIVGSRIFGNFRRKGSFLQRDGIEILENVDDILG